MKNIIAIIPARGGSKGIPHKNIADFCGRPLLAWTIEQASKSVYINEVYVSSDDKKIIEIARSCGAKTIVRPGSISGDTSTAEEAIKHALAWIKAGRNGRIDIVVLLQVTSPLRGADDIDSAIKTFISRKADSLFSAATLDDFCAWKYCKGKLRSITYDYKNRGRRQDREPYFLENGSIYIFKPEVINKYNNRLGGKIVLYDMGLWKSFEIDRMDDFDICEYYMKKKLLRKHRHIKESKNGEKTD